ncbi:YjcZ family sporulation protein [Cytobacillus massiliigabonensis]|uniref:YjcZ family sporulation protein n=1 Tax=Cytobacillus massiliigabonensis TaxID=1871011 RepID=UPI000C8585F4|nr:YjcZ family sporulation protein [Cytobacillus massiliigabonensis]
MQYGYGGCGIDPCFSGYGYPVGGAYGGNCGFSGGFALIVVLFILLIIIGASCYGAW